MTNLSHKQFHWEDMDLIFQDRVIASLIPHEKYEKHWHIKFEWRNEKSPEFFNIFNARENARIYCLKHYQEKL